MNRKSHSGEVKVGLGYAEFQIARALITQEQHEDAATRERAQLRISNWVAVFNGILNGTLDIGARTPLSGVPAWATLEVVTGGFATGQLLAGGPLLEHERDLLAGISSEREAGARRWLNGYFLTDKGLGRLEELLQTGLYEMRVPEEGALLVVAWLARNGYAEKARQLLDEISPWFDQLRFYPVPASRPRQLGARVFLQDVGHAITNLRQIGPNPRILAQKEAVLVWALLYDRAVRLFLETVEGETPNLRSGPDGRWVRSEDGSFPIIGGWPCRSYPEGWSARASNLLDEYDELRTQNSRCNKSERKDSFAQLRHYLRKCVDAPVSLDGRDVGRIRLILARYVASHGTPDSLQRRELRERQRWGANRSTFPEIAAVVISRLELHPADRGLEDLSGTTQPISAEESGHFGIEQETPVPPSLQRKVRRCLYDSVDVLIEQGIVTSAETLAIVLPQMTSGIRAAGVTDPALRQLLAVIYTTFRRRRSLLLMNLEKQIQFEELPWVAVIDEFRSASLSDKELARQTMRDVVLLAIVSFPHAILPNKLLQELQALATTAKLDLPLVEEVAADIFMGRLSGKFPEAAKRAANLLEGTLYSTYYGIEYQPIRQMPKARKDWPSRFRKSNAKDRFVKLCEARSGVSYGDWNPAINGMILEQVQILTSQNLAVLYAGLNLGDALDSQLDDLARRCFAWICQRLQTKVDNWHADLIRLKNAAYAWRQMIFFLSQLPEGNLSGFLLWAEDYLDTQPAEFNARFQPVFKGLALAAEGHSLESDMAIRSGARRFLGWANERHWLMKASFGAS
jgi:hypothetical protein